MTRPDFAIVGGGVIGLALADTLLRSRPGASVVVHEKETGLAKHASGRNSGVLHAGFYYASDTLKARLTRGGNVMLREFCAERGVPVRETGKVVVARSAQEVPSLHELHRRGRENGVPVELIDDAQLREIEPLARSAGTALWSPSTAVADPVAVVEALGARVREQGGQVIMGSEIVAAGPGWLRDASGTRTEVGHLINAAGLRADVVAHWFGVGEEYRLLPFTGLYWYGNWPEGRLRRHVYPVPDPRNPFLGVHLTVTVDGGVKIGPTALPAPWRENYGGFGGFSASELWDTARTYPSFLTSPHHDALGLVRTELPKYRRQRLVHDASALVPSIRVEDFTKKGRRGVRAQLYDLRNKRLEMDFVVRPGERSTHVLNAVSPAWTSALAVAEHVVAGIDA